MTTKTVSPPRPENPLLNIGFNVVLPYLILTRLPAHIDGESGPRIALVVGLAIPILYGAWDYFSCGRKNWISVLGVVNTALTGVFALSQMTSFWYVVKETSVPFVLGIALVISSYTLRPFISVFVESALNLQLIQERLAAQAREAEFVRHLQRSNMFLASSFFISALLNFIIAQHVFRGIDAALPAEQRDQILNEQIARMTWMGYLMISLPLVLLMIFVIRYLLTGIRKITGLTMEEIFASR